MVPAQQPHTVAAVSMGGKIETWRIANDQHQNGIQIPIRGVCGLHSATTHPGVQTPGPHRGCRPLFGVASRWSRHPQQARDGGAISYIDLRTSNCPLRGKHPHKNRKAVGCARRQGYRRHLSRHPLPSVSVSGICSISSLRGFLGGWKGCETGFRQFLKGKRGCQLAHYPDKPRPPF